MPQQLGRLGPTAPNLACRIEMPPSPPGMIRGGVRPSGLRKFTRSPWQQEVSVLNLLRHFGIVKGAVIPPKAIRRPKTRLLQTPDRECYVIAEETGVYEPFFDLGDQVKKGQTMGRSIPCSIATTSPSLSSPSGPDFCSPSGRLRPYRSDAASGSSLGTTVRDGT